MDLPNIVRVLKSRRMRWAGHVVFSVYRVLVGKPKGKRQLGIPMRKLEDNINMDFQEWGHGLDRSDSG